MFQNCTSLTNLNIKHFDISSVTDGTNFLVNANNALTTTAYDELLEAWAAQDVQPNVPWHFGNAQYTVETVADWYSPRNASSLSIINNKLVSIADGTAVFGAGQQVDNLIVGNVYKMKARSTCNNAAATMFLTASASTVLTPSVIFTQGTSTALIDNLFTATATTMYFGVVVSGHAANDTVTIDAGITVKEITNYTEANAASEIEYSQENVFGSEEVVNGDFATDSDWTLSNQVSIANGVLNIQSNDGSYQFATQTITGAQIGKVYEATFNITRVGANGIIKVAWAGDTSATRNARIPSIIGTHKVIWPHNGTSNSMSIGRNSGGEITDIDISDFSLKEITNAVEYKNIPQSARELYSLEDDTWVGSNELVVNGDFATDLSGWSDITGNTSWDNGAMLVSSPSLTQFAARQALAMTLGASYQVNFSIVETSGGAASVYLSNDAGGLFYETSIGYYSNIMTNNSSLIVAARVSTGTTVKFDNVSVKQVIEVAS